MRHALLAIPNHTLAVSFDFKMKPGKVVRAKCNVTVPFRFPEVYYCPRRRSSMLCNALAADAPVVFHNRKLTVNRHFFVCKDRGRNLRYRRSPAQIRT